MINFYNKKTETLPKDELQQLQLNKFRKLIDQALKTPFYQKKLKTAGISSGAELKEIKDIQKLPFTVKDDLRDAFPDGLLAVDRQQIVRLHASSGTTGIPTVIYHTKKDLVFWTELVVRSLAATGCTPADVLQNMMTYGLFTGGLGVHYGAEQLGMLVIPASSGNTQKQLKMMVDFGTTVVHATPSYMLHLFSKLETYGIQLSQLKLRKALIGAEPHTEDIRRKIEELFQIDAYNSFGLSEMNGPGVAFECQLKTGMHLWEDAFYMEIIDPVTLEPVEDGMTGELVLTNLNREATPILRYRTRDLTSIIPGDCACGRTHRRINRIIGRTDDMLIINGVNVFPSQIEEVLMSMPEVGTNYQIIIEKQQSLDKLIVKTEIHTDFFNDTIKELEALISRIKDNLRSSIFINPKVELHETGVLPVYEGKAIRVIDNRKKK